MTLLLKGFQPVPSVRDSLPSSLSRMAKVGRSEK